LVLDLSPLWAGPLAGRLLGLAGAEVVKIEHPRRPDAMRDGDPALFARLNQGKASITIDFAQEPGRAALLALIARADIVIEAARPRALVQLGIDADALVAAQPGLVWLTITGHGAGGPQANWVGFGDDAAVAGGLSAALLAASGEVGFAGDAPADPLTGIVAALAGWRAWCSGAAEHIDLSMSAVVATALAEERATDPDALTATLQAWSRARGTPFPACALRPVAEVRLFGADTAAWLAC
jgi:crotonobetainyl-CoA:carnitine CoA-transferase CaiB-like acyl-CoA transferase